MESDVCFNIMAMDKKKSENEEKVPNFTQEGDGRGTSKGST